MTTPTKQSMEKVTWGKVVDVLEEQFPKGKCQERGHALVLIAYAKMALDQAIQDACWELQKNIDSLVKEARQEENEACAKIADVGIGKEPLSEASWEAKSIADSIRSRMNQEKRESDEKD